MAPILHFMIRFMESFFPAEPISFLEEIIKAKLYNFITSICTKNFASICSRSKDKNVLIRQCKQKRDIG